VYVELFAADDFDRGKADEEQGSSPDARDGVLLAAGICSHRPQRRETQPNAP